MRASVAFERYPDQAIVPNWCHHHFGLAAATFAQHAFVYRPGAPAIWIVASDADVPHDPLPETVGLLVMRKAPPRGKPTSVFLQRFGGAATRNVYILGPDDAERFLRRETLTVVPVDDGRGYCVVRTADYVLGCGRVEGTSLISEVPRSWLGQ